jgi:hypothetical protein
MRGRGKRRWRGKRRPYYIASARVKMGMYRPKRQSADEPHANTNANTTKIRRRKRERCGRSPDTRSMGGNQNDTARRVSRGRFPLLEMSSNMKAKVRPTIGNIVKHKMQMSVITHPIQSRTVNDPWLLSVDFIVYTITQRAIQSQKPHFLRHRRWETTVRRPDPTPLSF